MHGTKIKKISSMVLWTYVYNAVEYFLYWIYFSITTLTLYMFFWVFPRRQIVGQLQFDAGEIPKRTYTIFKSRRKFEIKNTYLLITVVPSKVVYLGLMSLMILLSLEILCHVHCLKPS